MSNSVDFFDQDITKQDADIYDLAWRSVLGSFQQCVAEMKQLGYARDDLQVVNLDDHSDIFSLPQTDIITLTGFNSYMDEKTVSFAWFVGVSTLEDTNNHRLSKMISYLYARFSPGKAIKVVDNELKEVSKLITTNNTQVIAMSRERNRSIQMISVDAKSTSVVL